MEYNIYGQISFYVDFYIEANSPEDAEKRAIEKIKDFYHLYTYSNAMHSDCGEPKIDISSSM
jgi:hypothetical protein